MGRKENQERRVKKAQQLLVTREHMIDYVNTAVRHELAAYHLRTAPIFRWWVKREARWYRRTWRWLRRKVARDGS